MSVRLLILWKGVISEWWQGFFEVLKEAEIAQIGTLND